MLRRTCELCLALAVAGCLAAAQDRKPGPQDLRLEWRDLPLMITGHFVKLALPDGTRLQGRVISVEPEALRLRIGKTSDRRAHPKGESAIAREMVTYLRLTKTRGYTWRVVGTILGGTAGFVLGAVAGYVLESPAAGVAVFSGVTGAGFWGGWASDHSIRTIVVVPDP